MFLMINKKENEIKSINDKIEILNIYYENRKIFKINNVYVLKYNNLRLCINENIILKDYEKIKDKIIFN